MEILCKANISADVWEVTWNVLLFSVGLIGGVDLINQLPPSFMLLLDIPFSF